MLCSLENNYKGSISIFLHTACRIGNREPSVLRADCKQLNSPFLSSADSSVFSHPPLQSSGCLPPHSLLSAPTPLSSTGSERLAGFLTARPFFGLFSSPLQQLFYQLICQFDLAFSFLLMSNCLDLITAMPFSTMSPNCHVYPVSSLSLRT